MMKYLNYIDSPIGILGLVQEEECLTEVFFGKSESRKDYDYEETPLLRETKKQLEAYFEGCQKIFDLPLNPKGTDFQKVVWQALLLIPYGETRSYKDIAAAIGSPKASRAVGMANNKNPLSILVPCHRVIGSSGKLVGYGGGLAIKEKLLGLERDNK